MLLHSSFEKICLQAHGFPATIPAPENVFEKIVNMLPVMKPPALSPDTVAPYSAPKCGSVIVGCDIFIIYKNRL